MTLKERYAGVLGWFEANVPVAESELCYESPWGLLVAVMLSAQCTDKRVNMITPALLAAFPAPAAMAKSSPDEIFTYIRSVSYPNAKARHLYATAQKICTDFGGEVPLDLVALQTLPGVGRKTANVMGAVLWDAPVMPVDTHVFRVANRIGLTRDSKTPLQTERVLSRHIPLQILPQAHHWLILHGRYVCTARAPKCNACGLAPWCAHQAGKK